MNIYQVEALFCTYKMSLYSKVYEALFLTSDDEKFFSHQAMEFLQTRLALKNSSCVKARNFFHATGYEEFFWYQAQEFPQPVLP